MGRSARLLDLVQREGLAGLARRALRRWGIHRRYVLLGGPDESRAEVPAVPIEASILGPDDLDAYLTYRPDRTRGEIERRLAEGGLGFLGRADGRIVSSVWTARGAVWLDYVPCRLLLGEGTYLAHDLHTVPELRGKRVADPVNALRERTMRAAGYELKVAVYEPENRAALWRGERRGNRSIGELSCLRIGPWRRVRLRLRDDGMADRVTLAT